MRFFSRSEGEKPAVEPELPFPHHAQQPAAQAVTAPAAATGQAGPPPQSPAPPAAAAVKPEKRRLLGRFTWKVQAAGYGAAALLAGGVVWLGAMLVYYTIAFPNPLAVRAKERAPVIRIVARDGTLLADRGAAHDYMPIDMMPQHLIDAVVATEDRRFFQHGGIDPAGMARAAFANLRAGRYVQGGSTLTQQLAKNLFLTSERTVSRKLDELALAIWLEVRLTKREILELYLNRVYFGGGAYGIESAAQRYFDKSARALSLAEAALIAGLLKAPSKYSPTSSPDGARARGLSVLAKMRDARLIAAADFERARHEKVRFSDLKAQRAMTGLDYAIDLILEKLPPVLGAEHAELIVETTIDAGLQRRANAVVQSYLDDKGKALLASQAALVALDADGSIRALIGGRSYADSQFNRATKARRQPGSVFKPFVYLTALERGIKPDTVTYDLPLTIDGWSPRNDNNQHVGALTMRQALAQSVNTVAVRLGNDLGISQVADTARRLGIQSELREDPSLSLGTSEMTLLELTQAYGVLSSGGTEVEPHVIRRVRLNTGRVLYARTAKTQRRLIAAEHVGAMNDMLNAALVAGTGRRAALPRHPAAGKTGTTQDFRDAWFIGYTAHMTTGVWIGNDDGTPMRRVMGGNLPAQIWHDVMLEAHKDKTPAALPGTSSHDTVASRSGEPPLARTEDREALPWLEPRPAMTSSHIERVPKSRSLAAVREKKPTAPTAAASTESKPAANRPSPLQPKVAGAPAASTIRAPIGQRLIVEPPTAAQPSSVARAAQTSQRAGPVAAPRRTTPPSPQHPQERISEDFLARVLDQQPAPAAVASSKGFDAAEIQRKLDQIPEGADRPEREAPHGMMSLGAGN